VTVAVRVRVQVQVRVRVRVQVQVQVQVQAQAQAQAPGSAPERVQVRAAVLLPGLELSHRPRRIPQRAKRSRKGRTRVPCGE
jgi:hypothetical protein